MKIFSATDFAILEAKHNQTLNVRIHNGRFGVYWIISDENGTIETHFSQNEARTRIHEVVENHKLHGDSV